MNIFETKAQNLVQQADRNAKAYPGFDQLDASLQRALRCEALCNLMSTTSVADMGDDMALRVIMTWKLALTLIDTL